MLKPSVWGSPQTVWEELKKNSSFSKELVEVNSQVVQFDNGAAIDVNEENQPKKIIFTVRWPENYKVNGSFAPHHNKEDADWVDEKLAEWILQMDLGYNSEDVQVVFDEEVLGLFVSLCWSTATREQLLIFTKHNIFITLVDELFAERSIQSMRKTLNQPDLDRWQVMQVWVNMILPDYDFDKVPETIRLQPILIAWQELCVELQKMATPEWINAFHWSVDMYAKSCYIEAAMASGKIKLSFEDYCILRLHNGACLSEVCLIDIISNFAIHRKGSPILSDGNVPYNKEFLRFYNDLFLGSQTLMNDVYSSYRESKLDGTLNAVKVLNLIKPDESISQHAQRLEDMTNNLIFEAEKNITIALENKLIDASKNEHVTEFIQLIRSMVKGMFDWQMLAPRYTGSQSKDPSYPVFEIIAKQR